jgi:virulence-associated protein VagC
MRKIQIKTKVTQQGVRVPKRFLKGVKEVEIRKNDGVILVVPVSEDPILSLGTHPIADEIADASEHHDQYLYSR